MQAAERKTGNVRTYSPAERIADLWLHLVGIAVAVTGVAALAAFALPGATAKEAFSLSLYATGLLAMLALSAIYHTFGRTPFSKGILRRFDHAAIFIMIAGTYTPFALLKIGGSVGTALVAWVLALALIGVGLKLVDPGRAKRLSIALYLGIGWSIAPVLGWLFASVALPVSVLVVVGGVVYTIGVPFYLWKGLRFHRVIWHACVLAAASCHYAAIFMAVIGSRGPA